MTWLLWVPGLILLAILIVIHRVRLLGLFVFVPCMYFLVLLSLVFDVWASRQCERLCDWYLRVLNDDEAPQ